MSMTDSVAELLTRIRNGSKARKHAIDVPASNLRKEIVRIMIDHNYIRDMIDLPDKKQGIIRIYLRYSSGDEPVIKGLKRISKPGLRQYYNAEQVRLSTFNNRGMAVLSTSSGVMTNMEAAQKRIGGEILLRCW